MRQTSTSSSSVQKNQPRACIHEVRATHLHFKGPWGFWCWWSWSLPEEVLPHPIMRKHSLQSEFIVQIAVFEKSCESFEILTGWWDYIVAGEFIILSLKYFNIPNPSVCHSTIYQMQRYGVLDIFMVLLVVETCETSCCSDWCFFLCLFSLGHTGSQYLSTVN